MLKKVSVILLLLIFISVSFTACTDSREIDDDIYPIMIGIDKGTTNKMRVIIQYPTYKVGGGGGGSGGAQGDTGKGDASKSNASEGANVHTIEASSVVEAINLFNTAISRTVVISHVKMLVISEEFAREGIENYVMPLVRFRDARRSIQVVISKGKAEDFIHENKTNIGDSLSKSTELMFNQSNKNGYFPQVSLDNIYERMLSPYSEAMAVYGGINNFHNLPELKEGEKSPLVIERDFLPGELPRSGVAKREFLGTAVFAGGKMVGTLNNNETRYMLMVIGHFKRGLITCLDKNDPKSSISFDIIPGRKPKITAKFEDGKPVINVKLNIEADVVTIQSRINYEDKNKINELNVMLKNYIEDGVKKSIEKTQKEYKSDIFGFGFKIARQFNTLPEFLQYNWLSHYPDAKVNVDVVVNVRRTGLMNRSGPVYTSEENPAGGI